jgi:ubiquitin-like 1-activating enzyme E1 A
MSTNLITELPGRTPAAPPAATAEGNNAITAEEMALYDRQIRLWGVNAQENIRKADVLLIRVKGLANEIAKNLVLAGIKSLTIIDHEVVTESDLGAQFFVTEQDVGRNVRAWSASMCEAQLTIMIYAEG